MKSGVNWKIGGPAGAGIMSVGHMFARACLRHGWQVFCYTEYPSLIRGGHNVYQIHASPKEIKSQKSQVEVLVALDQQTIIKNQAQLSQNGILLYDPVATTLAAKKPDRQYLEVPWGKMSQEICGSDLMKNTIALGASLALYQGDAIVLKKLIQEEFADKNQKIINDNLKAVEKGYQFIKKNAKIQMTWPALKKIRAKERILVSGNEAAGLGALAAGCKFYVAYPMTPATSILHFLAKYERDYDLLVKQAEDEIAVINMAIGAAFAGVRSMCATSGGGFALMNESLGFAGIAEIPLVVILSQRTGPATGLPTWTGQSELLYAINASHGEFLRVVMAPGDASETFWSMVNAFNLADKYQIPVIVLLDKYLSESPSSLETFDTKKVTIKRGEILTQAKLNKIKDYKRYQFTKSGISPRSLPGLAGGEHQANSDEHDEYGYSTEDAAIRQKMMDKRAAKLSGLVKELPQPKIYGSKNAALTIICWGSSKMPAVEALNDLKDVRVMHLQYLCPFPAQFIKKNVNPEKSIIIEGNQNGQLQQLIQQHTGLNIKKTLLKYDGRPFYPEEIVNAVNQLKR